MNLYSLTTDQLELLNSDGYLIIRNVIPKEGIIYARRIIYGHIGANGIPMNEISTFNAKTYVPKALENEQERIPLQHLLLQSPVWNQINHKFGPFMPIPNAPQVAIRFPSNPFNDQLIPDFSGPHIDGISTGDNGIHKECLHSFSFLVGIALSSQMHPYMGNFTVYPKSHLNVCDFFKKQWEEQGILGVQVENRKLGPNAGCGWVSGSYYPPNAIDGIAPLQLFLQEGDVIICHYQLVHTVACNRSDEIRINLYWRMKQEGFIPLQSIMELTTERRH